MVQWSCWANHWVSCWWVQLVASPCNQKPSLTEKLCNHFNQSSAKLAVNVLSGYIFLGIATVALVICLNWGSMIQCRISDDGIKHSTGLSLGIFYKVTVSLDWGNSFVNYSQGRYTEGIYSISKTLFKWALEYLYNGEELKIWYFMLQQNVWFNLLHFLKFCFVFYTHMCLYFKMSNEPVRSY